MCESTGVRGDGTRFDPASGPDSKVVSEDVDGVERELGKMELEGKTEPVHEAVAEAKEGAPVDPSPDSIHPESLEKRDQPPLANGETNSTTVPA